MPILLPPSEAKRPGGRGRPLAGRRTDTPIEAVRASVLDALAALLADPTAAERALLLPASVAAAAIEQNQRLWTAPTMPAMRRYAGVVYAGLALDQLTLAAQRLAGRELLVFSGLFGVLRGADPVPDYRVPAKAALPGIGVVGTYWKRALTTLLPPMLGGRSLIVDLRSSDYAAMWQPAEQLASRTVVVRVLSRRPDGSYGVISYPSKLAKGRLAAALLERAVTGRPVNSAAELAEVWLDPTGCAGADARCRTGRLGSVLELVE